MQTVLENAAASAGSCPLARFSGRGIVICAGGPIFITNAYVLVRHLRETLRCALPIEIWHLGSMEMPALLAGQLQKLGCEVIDACDILARHPAQVRDGWQLKAYVLKHSRFAEVLLLDADQVPVTDPHVVFDWPEFTKAGAVFWPDRIDIASANPVWSLCGLEPRRMPSFESGQLAVDKRRHWQAICVALAINEHAETFYRLIYGDKDTFLLAWLFTSSSYALVPHRPVQDSRWHGQRDFAGEVVFQHRTNCKWSLHETPVRPVGFRYQNTCERFLKELAEIWDGRIFIAPDRSSAAMAMEAELVNQGHFLLSIADGAPQSVVLLRGHQLGAGRSYRFVNWHVDDSEQGLELVFRDHSKAVLRLSSPESGYWTGRLLHKPDHAVVLEVVWPQTEKPITHSTSAGLVGAVVDAALRQGSLDTEGEAGLLTTLLLLAKVEPSVPDALERYLLHLSQATPETSRRLKAIMTILRRHSGNERRETDHEMGSLLGDNRHYIEP